MVAWGHTATGAVIGSLSYSFFSDKPAEGLILAGTAGLISHYLLDLIPHGHFYPDRIMDQNLWRIAVFDFLLSVFVFLAIVYFSAGFSMKVLFVLFGIGGAVLPDCFYGIYKLGVIKNEGLFKKEREFHESTHWFGIGEKLPMISLKDVWQLLTVLICLYLVVKF